MRHYLIASLILVVVCLSLLIPQASALPVSYNQTALNFGLTSVPRNSSSYDVFPLIPDNWLWEKFDNNTIDSSPLSITGTVTYNTNLKALWKFENVLTDSSTSGKTLTKAAGTTTFTTSAEEGSGLVLDGSTYYTASDASLPTGTNPISVSTWINLQSLAGFPMYFCYGTSGGHTQFDLFVNSGIISFYDGTTSTAIATTSLSTNTWYYVTVTYDGTNARTYINGVLDKTTAITVNTSLAGGTGLNIGAISGGASNKMTGKLDEFRVYSGTALTLQQHQSLYMIGHYSQSHTFDGGEYVTTTNFANFERTNPFSVTLWYKGTFSGSIQPLVTKLSGAFGSQGWDFSLNGNQPIFTLANSGGGQRVEVQSTNHPNDGTWHQLAVTYSGNSLASGVSLYVDGLLQTNSVVQDNLASSIQNNANVIIGSDTSNVNFLQGQLDNVKIYPYALSSSQITSDYNSISPISSGKQFMSWYNGISGSSTLTKKLGIGQSTITLSCSLNTVTPEIISNNTNLYYACTQQVKQVPVMTGTSVNYFVTQDPSGVNKRTLFSTMQNILTISSSGSGLNAILSTKNLNSSLGASFGSGAVTVNNQVISNGGAQGIKYNMNTTGINNNLSGNKCEINYKPTNTTKVIDNIACDQSVPAMAIKYWNGFMIQKVANYNTNSTQQFLSSIDNSAYKKLLSLPCLILVNENPCITFIATDFSNTDYIVVLTSTHVYYGNAQTVNNYLLNHNYALQSYDIITPLTTSSYEIQNPILQGITLYGFNVNTTINKAGLFTLPSGYTTKTTTINSAIRTIDPRWTNDATDIPIITTTQSLFPIFLTALNAPAFSAIKVTQPTQIINGQEAVYAVAQLDSTRSVEFDLVAGTCANIYIADISVSPTVWDFEGIICATGVNQKTIAFTNTVPFTFYTLKYGVTDSFVPSNNGLTTTFHTNVAPTTYTVIIRNSTGTIAINSTFTVPANTTQQTQSFNLTGVTKPAALSVTVAGNQIYSAYLGSPLSLANMASFFHQYFNYQGFDFLSFIPVIFASMFTRNTVGVGMALTVVCIATLSWLSLVVVPEPVVYVSIFVACIGMVGYRLVGYL